MIGLYYQQANKYDHKPLISVFHSLKATSTMDLKTLLHSLHKEVSCPVCMITFTDPKILPCLHSFCLRCLNELQRTSGSLGLISCPECRGEFRIPGSGKPHELPTNFRMNSLLDVLAIQECNTAGAKCGNCDKRSAQCFYCFQCCVFWCEDCVTAHNIIRANNDHRVLAIKDFQDQDIEDVLKRPAFCQKKHHENEELKFFCKDCEVAICNTCVVTLHEGHIKMSLEEVASERKLRVQTVLEYQKQEANQKRNRIAELRDDRVKIQAQVAGLKRNAQSFADNMMKIIEAKKQEIFKQAEAQAKESLERLETQQCKVEHELQRIETEIEKTETLLTRSTSAEIVQLDATFLKRVSDDCTQLDCDVEDPGCFIFVENKTLLDNASCDGIGSVGTFLSKTKAYRSSANGKGISEATVGLVSQIVLTTRSDEEEQCYEELDCITMEIRNQQGQECSTVAKVQDNKDGTYNISYFAKEPGPSKASVMVNGEHVRGSPFAVQIIARQFKAALSFGQQGSSVGTFGCPWGVAVNERNEIAVTDRDNNRVQVFSSDGTYLRSFGRVGDQQGEFDSPRGIAFHNENIIVADRFNSRVQIFSGQGEYLREFGGEGNLDHQLDDPWGLSVDSDGNIIVTDYGNQTIKIFSPSGQFIRKFGGKCALNRPIHCIQKNSYLIVSDAGDHCIKLFNMEGKFIYQFGKEGEGDGEFNEPFCLSIDKAGHLLVCDRGNYRVQAFDLDGKFIAKFGIKGSEIGELKKTVSTGVLTDGSIVVSDYWNDCIQIFE